MQSIIGSTTAISLAILSLAHPSIAYTNEIPDPSHSPTDPVSTWTLFGPGDADQVTSLTVTTAGIVYLGTDIGGLYKSGDDGESWQAINDGLLNYDVTTPVIVAPDDPETLYLGTRGGFFKSTNGGDTWRNPRAGLPAEAKSRISGSVGSIAIAPTNNETLYMGLGYRPSSEGTRTVRDLKWSRDIFVSHNQGETWARVSAFPEAVKVHQLVPSTEDPGLIYAATSGGLFAGKPSERVWRRLTDKKIFNLVLLENGVVEIIAAAGADGILRSEDAGRTWQPINNGLGFWPHPSGPNRYSGLMVATGTDEIFAVNSTWGRSGGLYKAAIADFHWAMTTEIMPESWLRTSRRMNAAAISPVDDDLIFLGSSRYVYRSTDGARTWEQLISRPTNGRWTHRGLNVFGHTRDIVVNPREPAYHFIATADHGITVSPDGGQTWEELKSPPEFSDTVIDLEFCDDGEALLLYAASRDVKGNYCLSVSDDNGESWQALCDGLPRRTALSRVMPDPSRCGNVVVGTASGLFRKAATDDDWVAMLPKHVRPMVNAVSAVGPDDDGLLVGTDSGLFLSDDSGDSWEEILRNDRANVTSILVSKSDHNMILVGAELKGWGISAVYRSSDRGKTWQRVMTNISKIVSGIVSLPGDKDILYLATNDHNFHDVSLGSGVFRSNDGGRTWKSVNNGLPVHRAWGISVSENYPWRVFLSANGSGAYFLDDPTTPGP